MYFFSFMLLLFCWLCLNFGTLDWLQLVLLHILMTPIHPSPKKSLFKLPIYKSVVKGSPPGLQLQSLSLSKADNKTALKMVSHSLFRVTKYSTTIQHKQALLGWNLKCEPFSLIHTHNLIIDIFYRIGIQIPHSLYSFRIWNMIC